MPDALDEYFEYDAEEFLVSLALLITEGRTPECSVKGRAESFHCPPAQSRFPGAARHECSDKLAQVRTGSILLGSVLCVSLFHSVTEVFVFKWVLKVL